MIARCDWFFLSREDGIRFWMSRYNHDLGACKIQMDCVEERIANEAEALRRSTAEKLASATKARERFIAANAALLAEIAVAPNPAPEAAAGEETQDGD